MNASLPAIKLEPHPNIPDAYRYSEGINGGHGRYYIVEPSGSGYVVEFGYITETVHCTYRVNDGKAYSTLDDAARAIAHDLDQRDHALWGGH